jgi:hypothetical protein
MEVSGQLHALSFTPGKGAFGGCWLGDLLGSRISLTLKKRKIFTCADNLKFVPQSSIHYMA